MALKTSDVVEARATGPSYSDIGMCQAPRRPKPLATAVDTTLADLRLEVPATGPSKRNHSPCPASRPKHESVRAKCCGRITFRAHLRQLEELPTPGAGSGLRRAIARRAGGAQAD